MPHLVADNNQPGNEEQHRPISQILISGGEAWFGGVGAGQGVTALVDVVKISAAQADEPMGGPWFDRYPAALYYATTIRPIPVRLLGPAACRLGDFLRAEQWLVQGPTRPLGFLAALPDVAALEKDLTNLTTSGSPR